MIRVAHAKTPLKALSLALVLLSPAAFAEEKFTFLTNWYAQAEHGGFYHAQAANLYKQAGLDVSLKMGGPQINSMQLMGAGQADCIISDNGQALQSWQAGVRAVTVATVFQKSPTVFIAHDDVKGPADFKNKTFLLATEAHTSYWPWAKTTLGLTTTKVKPYTFSVQPFLADKNVIQQGYISSEPFAISQSGQSFKVFPLSDLGYPVYGNSIVCSAAAISKKPAAVAAFVKASMQGWKAYVTNPAQGNAAIKKANPAMTDQQLTFAMAQMTKYELITGGDAKTQGIGVITEARLKKSYDMLVANKLIDAAKVPLKDTYTLQFIQPLNIK